jgi:hypothetical protein
VHGMLLETIQQIVSSLFEISFFFSYYFMLYCCRVSGSRVLMSQPRARLGVVAYCLFLHLWFLGSIVL